MKPFELPTEKDSSRFTRRVTELRTSLSYREPLALASLAGVHFLPGEDGTGRFTFPLWGKETRLSFPEFVASNQDGAQLPDFLQALVLYYFSLADGTPLSKRWIAFTDLPDGRFYNQAFQGYTGKELARAFRDNQAAFESAALAAGGLRQPLGGVSFSFQALPRAVLLAVFWPGDEDFPSTIQVLFDASISHYQTTDGCAILGSMLTRRIIEKGLSQGGHSSSPA